MLKKLLLAILRLRRRVRLGRYCVEMHSGTVLGALSFLYWLLKGCEETGAKAVFTLYWIAFALARKPYEIGLLLTLKNGDFCNVAKLLRSAPMRHIG